MEKKTKKIRYGVVGLGNIAQSAVLPAFKNASSNSVLTTLISEDKQKLKVLAKKYKVKNTYLFEDLEECFMKREIDAIYIATPNDHHRQIVELAAQYKINVLCEKPMAVTLNDCLYMDQVAKKHNIKMMVAYRLHFEAANLEAIKMCRQGTLGDLKFFNSSFSYQVKDKKNIRLNPTSVGGGALYDIGIYCINASRYLFQAEPIEVVGLSVTSDDPRFINTEETTSVILRFPNDKLAAFTVSFGAYDSSDYEIIGEKGRIRLENAYDYATPMELRTFLQTRSGEMKKQTKKYKKRDQFSAELLYFSDCIIKNKTPEPGPVEGTADVKIIQAILESIHRNQPVSLDPVHKQMYPTQKQKIIRPGVRKRKLFHATGPSKD
ncbi:gfo/Idh/MocA family oxidoreductase [Bacteriovorax stolpii]|uniref:Gfo/Idh/MocA family oxidoreductase n=1 Tax=Bacteriovorax stolpii TaxID=960 RepID=A0A2K9NSQ8_BACTC|nr:Gfo/Idh/MocA family oxidoreductase [Bacteriovorax stolpii]AUN97784.1 gfo/Idh/MocA family oxidoreductase [Bacteriovorax stolpii]TDP51605.1 glucose-fructose oxidoreductase [Bacteriovorax stolpii]